jgi:hypothetical protein
MQDVPRPVVTGDDLDSQLRRDGSRNPYPLLRPLGDASTYGGWRQDGSALILFGKNTRTPKRPGSPPRVGSEMPAISDRMTRSVSRLARDRRQTRVFRSSALPWFWSHNMCSNRDSMHRKLHPCAARSRCFSKGTPFEREGRKASGLRGISYDSGVAVL